MPQIRPCRCGATFAAPAVLCGCADATGGEPDWEEGEGGGAPSVAAGFSEAAVLFEERYEDDPPSGVSADVRFSDAAAFFEDAYANAPGDAVARRATRTTLEIEASASGDGAILHVEAENIARLTRVGGDALSFPFTRMLADGESVSYSVIYEPETPSGAEGDIAVRARIKPPGGATASAQARATAVKVQLTALAQEPANQARHVYGIRESVVCQTIPVLQGMTWDLPGGSFKEATEAWTLTCPWTAYNGNLRLTGGGGTYETPVEILEPQAIQALEARAVKGGTPPGLAGDAQMLLELYVFPTNVSFSRIALMEVPTSDGFHSGYFDDDQFSDAWNHTCENGAGRWHNVTPGNKFMTDSVSFSAVSATGVVTAPPPWRDGLIIWNIPIAWGERNSAPETAPKGHLAARYNQIFSITGNGTVSVLKFGNTVSRSTNGVVRLNGAIVQ